MVGGWVELSRGRPQVPGGVQCNASRKRGTLQQQCNQSMALTPEQIYKLGAEALGWNSSTAAGKALVAEDMKLLKRLQLAHTYSYSTDWPNQYTAIGRK